jgi:hypothetical protein
VVWEFKSLKGFNLFRWWIESSLDIVYQHQW